MATGIQIRHDTLKSCIALVPVVTKPFRKDSIKQCPTCKIVHPVKTIHLSLDDTGACIVSEGVLNDLRTAGMPELSIVGTVENPPTLHIGAGRTRDLIDFENRRQTIYQAIN